MAEVPTASPPDGVDETAWFAAVAAVRNYCGWHIAPSVSEVLTVDGSGASTQMLPTLHVTDVRAVTNDGRDISDPEWSPIGMIRTRGRFTDRLRGVTVDLVHGYDEWPDDVRRIIADLATLDGRPLGASQMQAGPFSVGLGSASTAQAQAGVVGLSGAHKSLLDRYRIGARP